MKSKSWQTSTKIWGRIWTINWGEKAVLTHRLFNDWLIFKDLFHITYNLAKEHFSLKFIFKMYNRKINKPHFWGLSENWFCFPNLGDLRLHGKGWEIDRRMFRGSTSIRLKEMRDNGTVTQASNNHDDGDISDDNYNLCIHNYVHRIIYQSTTNYIIIQNHQCH
jgi:hypothetical protein